MRRTGAYNRNQIEITEQQINAEQQHRINVAFSEKKKRRDSGAYRQIVKENPSFRISTNKVRPLPLLLHHTSHICMCM